MVTDSVEHPLEIRPLELSLGKSLYILQIISGLEIWMYEGLKVSKLKLKSEIEGIVFSDLSKLIDRYKSMV